MAWFIHKCHNGDTKWEGLFWVSSPTHSIHPTHGWSCRDWFWQWVQVQCFPWPAWLLLCISWQILALESADPSVVAVSFGVKQVRKADPWFQLGPDGPGRNDLWISPGQGNICCSVSIRMRKTRYLITFGKWKWKILNSSIQRLAAPLCIIKYFPCWVFIFIRSGCLMFCNHNDVIACHLY